VIWLTEPNCFLERKWFAQRAARDECIARRAADIAGNKRLKPIAEAIARHPEFAPEKKTLATSDDERPD